MIGSIENRKTVWYDSRFYRLNILWENGAFFIRDLHRFDEKVVAITHDTPLTTTVARLRHAARDGWGALVAVGKGGHLAGVAFTCRRQPRP